MSIFAQPGAVKPPGEMFDFPQSELYVGCDCFLHVSARFADHVRSYILWDSAIPPMEDGGDKLYLFISVKLIPFIAPFLHMVSEVNNGFIEFILALQQRGK